MSADGWTISGLVLGAMGAIGLVQIAWAIIRIYLPEQQLKSLEEVLDENDHLLRAANEDGYLNEEESTKLKKRLAQCHDKTEKLRVEVYNRLGTIGQLWGLCTGLTSGLMACESLAVDIRADISAITERERFNLELQDKAIPPSRDPYVPSRKKRRHAGFKAYQPFASFHIPPGIQHPQPPTATQARPASVYAGNNRSL